METVNYRITEGSDYGWQCYGVRAYRLDSWDGDHEGHSASIIFDTDSQVVYEASVYDYRRNLAYRRINPAYRELHDIESKKRGVDSKQAWDDVRYCDLETDEDFLIKAKAIVQGRDYDERVEVPLELADDLLFDLMKMAHSKDITLNKLVENIISEFIEVEENKNVPNR